MLLERVKREFEGEYKGVEKCVLAFSGGLDSVVMASMLREMGIEVVPVFVDLGQKVKLKDVERLAKKVSSKFRHVDARQDFVKNVEKAIKANCLAEGYVGSKSLSRPLIAKCLVDVAKEEGAQAVAHGSSGMGNDHLRMDNALNVLGPEFRIIAPVRDWNMKRDEEIEYARKKKLPMKTLEKPYSDDENLWARSMRYELAKGREKDSIFLWTVSPEKAPDRPTYAEIYFDNGVPVSVTIRDGRMKEVTSTKDVIPALNKEGGKNGIGRMDVVEDKVAGLKTRDIYESPAACILIAAHRELERLTLTSGELDVKSYIDNVWNRAVYDGKWFTRIRMALEGFIDYTQKAVDGKVTVKMYKGNVEIIDADSKHALYDERLGKRDKKSVWDQREARHFAKLYGLQDIMAFVIETD